MNLLEQSFDNQPLVTVGKLQFILNPLTEQMPATPPALLREAASRSGGC